MPRSLLTNGRVSNGSRSDDNDDDDAINGQIDSCTPTSDMLAGSEEDDWRLGGGNSTQGTTTLSMAVQLGHNDRPNVDLLPKSPCLYHKYVWFGMVWYCQTHLSLACLTN